MAHKLDIDCNQRIEALRGILARERNLCLTYDQTEEIADSLRALYEAFAEADSRPRKRNPDVND